MGFGFGPASEMQKSVKANKAQLRKRNSLKENIEIYGTSSDEKYEYNEFSEEEMEAFKLKVKQEKAIEDRNRIIIICSAVVGLVILGFLFNSVL
ncbi:hypothetical protein [Aureivirga sp. CE67]|uniref:hypothetical protein n=1 Tax=Aureivirga sp. CE67 TaxID=1788983 RepID=UPI0018C8EAAD|nr:hypothetical protein [Aureivirga sp. CE67]